jgi:hypothetical protein
VPSGRLGRNPVLVTCVLTHTQLEYLLYVPFNRRDSIERGTYRTYLSTCHTLKVLGHLASMRLLDSAH